MQETRTVKVSEYFCDRCGEQLLGYEEAEFYVDADIWEEHADDAGWREIDGKHYCPDCWCYDDNDNPIEKIYDSNNDWTKQAIDGLRNQD